MHTLTHFIGPCSRRILRFCGKNFRIMHRYVGFALLTWVIALLTCGAFGQSARSEAPSEPVSNSAPKQHDVTGQPTQNQSADSARQESPSQPPNAPTASSAASAQVAPPISPGTIAGTVKS